MGPLTSYKKSSKVKSLSQLALFKGEHEISWKSSQAGFECHSSRFIAKLALSKGMVPTQKNMALAHLDPMWPPSAQNPGGDVGPDVCVGCVCGSAGLWNAGRARRRWVDNFDHVFTSSISRSNFHACYVFREAKFTSRGISRNCRECSAQVSCSHTKLPRRARRIDRRWPWP